MAGFPQLLSGKTLSMWDSSGWFLFPPLCRGIHATQKDPSSFLKSSEFHLHASPYLVPWVFIWFTFKEPFSVVSVLVRRRAHAPEMWVVAPNSSPGGSRKMTLTNTLPQSSIVSWSYKHPGERSQLTVVSAHLGLSRIQTPLLQAPAQMARSTSWAQIQISFLCSVFPITEPTEFIKHADSDTYGPIQSGFPVPWS